MAPSGQTALPVVVVKAYRQGVASRPPSAKPGRRRSSLCTGSAGVDGELTCFLGTDFCDECGGGEWRAAEAL
jgi:hypothetical protein